MPEKLDGLMKLQAKVLEKFSPSARLPSTVPEPVGYGYLPVAERHRRLTAYWVMTVRVSERLS